MTLPVTFRAPRGDDAAFVIDSWLASNRTAPAHAAIWSEAYYRTYRPVVMALVRSSHITIAANPEDADHILGYAVWSPAKSETATHSTGFALHYVYVKEELRRRGLGAQMLRQIRPSFGDEPVVVTAACRPAGASAPCWADLVTRWRLRYEPYQAVTAALR